MRTYHCNASVAKLLNVRIDDLMQLECNDRTHIKGNKLFFTLLFLQYRFKWEILAVGALHISNSGRDIGAFNSDMTAVGYVALQNKYCCGFIDGTFLT